MLSLRDDFLVRCCELPPLAPILKDLTVLLTPGRDGLRRAVTEPAASRGYRFEDEALVEEMVSAVEGSRGALPLLAFAVSRLWEGRDRERRLLTRAAYREVGGVEGALARHAEGTLERIGGGHEAVVREIFRNLATSQGTRAAMEREELLSAFSDRATAEEVLRLLVNARLLTTYEVERREGGAGRHRVEVVHESLLEAWPRLARWRARDEEGAVLRDQLRQAARLWEEKGRPPDLLWTGTSYREFALWREHYPGALTALEEDFARSMAQPARRRTRLLWSAAAGTFLVLAVVTLVVGLSRQQANDARVRAEDQARHAEASKLLAIAQLRLDNDPTEALAFATASLELDDVEQTRIFALQALTAAPPAREVATRIGDTRVPAWSPDGSLLAVVGHSAEGGIWNQEGMLLARLPGHDTSPRGSNVAEWADSDVLVTGLPYDYGSRVQVWALPDGRKVREIDFGAPTRWQVGMGRLFAYTAQSEQPPKVVLNLRAWNLPKGDEEALGAVNWTDLGARLGLFAPDGSGWLYTKDDSIFIRPLPVGRGSDRIFSRHRARSLSRRFLGPDQVWTREVDGPLRLWNFRGPSPALVAEIPPPEAAPDLFSPEPSGHWAWIKANADPFAQVWSVDALPGARPLKLRRNASWYGASCAIHPAGNWLVCSTEGLNRLTFWPLPQNPAGIVDGYVGLSRPVAFSPDSHWLATSWEDGGLRVWPLPGAGSRQIRNLGAPKLGWRGLVFDPAGRYLFAVGYEGNAWIFPMDGSAPRKLDGFGQGLLLDACAVSPSGRFAAAAPAYGTGTKELRVHDLQTGAVRSFPLPVPEPSVDGGPSEAGAQRTGYEGGIKRLEFVGEDILYSSGEGGIRRWDLERGTQTLVWEAQGAALFMSMTADGRYAFVSVVPRTRSGTPATEWKNLKIDLSTGLPIACPEAEAGSRLAARYFVRGPVLAAGTEKGPVLVGPVGGGPPHLLVGHVGPSQFVDVSPDLKWIASAGEDNTLRLWPMPDLSKPPLHTLPHDEMIAKLKSLTNLRAVRDPEAEGGWKIELAPFPGWKDVPTW